MCNYTIWSPRFGQGFLALRIARSIFAFAALFGFPVLTIAEDLPELKPLSTSKPIKMVQRLAFSPDGKSIAVTGKFDDSFGIAILDAVTLKEQYRLQGYTTPTISLCYVSPDELVVGCTGGTIDFWDLKGKAKTNSIREHTDTVQFLTVSAQNAKTLVSAGWDEHVLVWDTANHKVVANLNHRAACITAAIAPDRHSVVSAGEDGLVRLWDVESQTAKSSWRADKDCVKASLFSHDGKNVISGGRDGKLHMWNIKHDKQIESISAHKQGVFALAFSPDGRFLISGGFNGDPAGGEIVVWKINTFKQLLRIDTHQGPTLSIVFNPNGQTLATVGYEGAPEDQYGAVKAWSFKTDDRKGSSGSGSQ
jgi:WD40 repeat protein